jgi:drug/metabolite transporter (DMT)-like permease
MNEPVHDDGAAAQNGIRGRLERLDPRAAGIACVLGAVIVFSTQDMAIKSLSGSYPLHEIILVRATIALAVTLSIFMPLEGGYGNLRTKQFHLHLLRGFAVVVSNMAFFTALASLAQSEATAIFFVAPLFITVLSIPLLGERVGPRRWAAVLVGLAGVIVIVRPGSDTFQTAALFPIVAALAYALLQVVTRKVGMSEKASTLSCYNQFTFIAVSALIGLGLGDGRLALGESAHMDFLLRAWRWPDGADLAIMIAIGCMSGVGGYLLSQAYRMSEAALVAPFEYAALPLAVFWSVVVWGDWPDALAWTGISLIAGAGLYVFFRETMLVRPARRS